MKQLMESVNDVGPMCRSGNTLLASFGGNEMILKMVPDVLKAELHVIAEIVLSTIEGLPIAEKKTYPAVPLYFYFPMFLFISAAHNLTSFSGFS